MKIQKGTPISYNIYSQNALKKSEGNVSCAVQSQEPLASTSQIPFTGMNKLVPKRMDVEAETKKLLKQIGEILEFDTSDFSPADYALAAIKKMLATFRNIETRKNALYDKLIELEADLKMPMKQKAMLLEQYRREYKAIQKIKLEPPKLQQSKKNIDGDKIDFQLLNKLKSAILKGDFNLLKVYKEHYKGLTDIEDLETLAKAYPKIKIPPTPEEVVSKKVLDTLTRDFFEAFDEKVMAQDADGAYDLSNAIIIKLCKQMQDKYNVDFASAYDKLAEPIHNAILRRYADIQSRDAFSTIPVIRKIKEPQITPTDIAMLRVNFDEFVLDVLRRQYLGSEKLNEIVYEGYGVRIPVRSLGSTEYKIGKASERLRQIVTTGEKIKVAQRDYDNFQPEELNKRLEFFANAKSGSDDTVLGKIIDFNSCQFVPEDITTLRQFLRRMDQFEDGDITLGELKNFMLQENLTPRGTEKLNALERQKLAQAMKLEQRKMFELTSKQDEFDDVINILYEQDMQSLASSCLKYRPLTLAPKELERAQYIIDVVNDVVSSANGRPVNKAKIEASITRWDTFNFYNENKLDAPIFKKALAFAKRADGSIDVDRAGQYLINSELVETYPQSKSFAQYPEVLEKIMERVSSKDKAIEYLFKFDDYTTLPASDKTKIVILNDIFDSNDAVQKQLLKYVIEGDYAKSETKILTRLNDKGDEVIESTFHPTAKQQIIDKYRYPVCMEYLQAFEEALATVAPTRGASGIKVIGSNNKAIQYKMEVKIKGHDDRLFSSKNNYIFDIFSARGMH